MGFHLFPSRTRQKRQAADPGFLLLGREASKQSAHTISIKNGFRFSHASPSGREEQSEPPAVFAGPQSRNVPAADQSLDVQRHR